MDHLTWPAFYEAAPKVAAPGTALLNQYGLGLGFIATVRKDGGPRLHPCCPIATPAGLFVFVLGSSPKRYDLDRDGRYALHSNPCPDNDDEFYIAGQATKVSDAATRERIANLAKHHVQDSEVLYELTVSRALHTTWKNPRQPNTEPVYTKWQAASSA